MSSIRVRYGMAEVELEAVDMRMLDGKFVSHGYPTDDLIEAAAQVLTAAGDNVRADTLRELVNPDVLTAGKRV